MKSILRIVFLCVVAGSAFSQSPAGSLQKHAVYVEWLGSCFLYSVNYDYRFRENTSLRVGFSKWKSPVLILFDVDYTGIPVMVNFLHGKGEHMLETGLGVVVGRVRSTSNEDIWGTRIRDDWEKFSLVALTCCYRFQPVRNGPIFRIGFTPLFSFDGVVPTGGLSVGASF